VRRRRARGGEGATGLAPGRPRMNDLPCALPCNVGELPEVFRQVDLPLGYWAHERPQALALASDQ